MEKLESLFTLSSDCGGFLVVTKHGMAEISFFHNIAAARAMQRLMFVLNRE